MPYQVATAYVPVVPTFKSWKRSVQETASSPDMQRAGKTAGDNVSAGFEAGTSRLKGLIKGAVATAGGAALAAATVGVRTAAGMETANIAFTTMLGSGKKAKTFLDQLSAFAAKTPFEFPELQTASQSLISIGIDANKVIPIMTTLGNVTAGMGTGSEGIKRATVAIQQMNAAQRISAEDLNQLRDAGIPVYELLSKAMGKSTQEVAALAQKGKLGKDALDAMMKALENGTGLERFNGMMEKQSTTLAGLWATLQDTFRMGMAQAIQPALPLLKDGLAAGIELLNAQMPALQAGIKGVVEQAPQVADRVRGIWTSAKALYDLVVGGDYSSALRDAFGWEEDSAQVDWILDMRDALSGLFDQVRSADAGALLTQVKDAVSDLVRAAPAAKPTLDLFGKGLQFAGDHADLLAKALPVLVAAFVAYKSAQAANAVAGRNSIVGFAAQLGTTISLTVATRALAKAEDSVLQSRTRLLGATVAATGAENVSLATKIRSTAVTAAKTVAEKAAALATRAYTAGQWLLNAALTANPIGLVILALVALGAAVVLAWKKSETFRAIVTAAWNGIKAAASGTVSWIRGTAWPWLRQAFDWIAGKARWLWDKGVKAPLTSFRRGIDVIRDAAGGLKDAIAKKWSGLVSAISGPVGQVLSWVSRNFITPINAMLAKVGIGFRLPTFSLPSTSVGRSTKGGLTRASGGVLPGWSPGTDDMHWWSPTLGSLSLSGGEAIMRPEWTRAVGKGFVDRMNAAARTGGVGAVRKAMGFAGGGIIGKIGGFASDMAGLLTDPRKLLRTLLPDVSKALNGNVFGRAMSGTVGRIIDALAKKISAGITAAPAAGSGVQRWRAVALQALSMAGAPASLLPLLLHRMQVESGGNPRAINLWDSNAKAGIPSMGLMQTILPTFNAYAGPLRSRGVWDPLANIYASIKYTQSRYGGNFARAWSGTAGYRRGGVFDTPMRPVSPPLLFDSGGTLPPTRPGEFIPVQNFTGAPERLRRVDGPGGGDVYQLYGVKYEAAAEVAANLSFARRAARRAGAYGG